MVGEDRAGLRSWTACKIDRNGKSSAINCNSAAQGYVMITQLSCRGGMDTVAHHCHCDRTPGHLTHVYDGTNGIKMANELLRLFITFSATI